MYASDIDIRYYVLNQYFTIGNTYKGTEVDVRREGFSFYTQVTDSGSFNSTEESAPLVWYINVAVGNGMSASVKDTLERVRF